MKKTVGIVARDKPFNYAGKELQPPPKTAGSRLEAYVEQVPIEAAVALVRNNMAFPACPSDAVALRKFGIRIASYSSLHGDEEALEELRDELREKDEEDAQGDEEE